MLQLRPAPASCWAAWWAPWPATASALRHSTIDGIVFANQQARSCVHGPWRIYMAYSCTMTPGCPIWVVCQGWLGTIRAHP
eukprot:SAG22_NODE_16_length_32723_cov_26.404825_39_plen_81_part_00